jgi:hypothetical protein
LERKIEVRFWTGNSWQAAVNPCKSISKSSTFIKELNILTYLQLKQGHFQSNLVGMIIIRESGSENEPVGITFRVSWTHRKTGGLWIPIC